MKNFSRRRFLQLAANTAALPAVVGLASAQAYPSRPITVIVPTGAGGPQDVIARIIIDHMQGALGQPLIIENVPGANVRSASVASPEPSPTATWWASASPLLPMSSTQRCIRCRTT